MAGCRRFAFEHLGWNAWDLVLTDCACLPSVTARIAGACNARGPGRASIFADFEEFVTGRSNGDRDRHASIVVMSRLLRASVIIGIAAGCAKARTLPSCVGQLWSRTAQQP